MRCRWCIWLGSLSTADFCSFDTYRIVSAERVLAHHITQLLLFSSWTSCRWFGAQQYCSIHCKVPRLVWIWTKLRSDKIVKVPRCFSFVCSMEVAGKPKSHNLPLAVGLVLYCVATTVVSLKVFLARYRASTVPRSVLKWQVELYDPSLRAVTKGAPGSGQEIDMSLSHVKSTLMPHVCKTDSSFLVPWWLWKCFGGEVRCFWFASHVLFLVDRSTFLSRNQYFTK